MEIAAIVISIASVAVTVIGSIRSNKRATEALNWSKRAASVELWSNLQDAIQRLIGFDPRAEPLGDRLANLRIAMIALVDELDWPGLDSWLDAERALGAMIGRQVMEAAKPGDTFEDRVDALDPLMRWAQVLGHNVRRFRREGANSSAAGKLQAHAEAELARVCAANGWPVPARSIPGVEPLDD